MSKPVALCGKSRRKKNWLTPAISRPIFSYEAEATPWEVGRLLGGVITQHHERPRQNPHWDFTNPQINQLSQIKPAFKLIIFFYPQLTHYPPIIHTATSFPRIIQTSPTLISHILVFLPFLPHLPLFYFIHVFVSFCLLPQLLYYHYLFPLFPRP